MNYSTKTFRARQDVTSCIIEGLCVIIIAWITPKTGIMPILYGCLGIIWVIAHIWRYHMAYIKIGNDFIAIRYPGPIGRTTTIFFDEIKSISQDKKHDNKVIITYINSKKNKISQTTIMLNLIKYDEQVKLLSLINSILGNKII